MKTKVLLVFLLLSALSSCSLVQEERLLYPPRRYDRVRNPCSESTTPIDTDKPVTKNICQEEWFTKAVNQTLPYSDIVGPCCQEFSKCFYSCGQPWFLGEYYACITEFRVCMVGQCAKLFKDSKVEEGDFAAEFVKCADTSTAYHHSLRKNGIDAYNQAQREYCQCVDKIEE